MLSAGVPLKQVHVASARCFIVLGEMRRGADVYSTRLRSRHLVHAFASKHSLRRDVSTAMIYNPKDRSIPLPSLRRGGRRHRVSISARRLRASCRRITELLEGAVAARAVQAEALRHFGAVCRSRTRIRLRSLAPSDLAGRANRDEGRIAQIDRM